MSRKAENLAAGANTGRTVGDLNKAELDLNSEIAGADK